MEQDAALRGQTARARGLEMESFPHCPLRGLRPPSPSGVLPSLATPQLAANETLDSAALSFFLNRALEEKEKEEEERVKREEEQAKRQEDQEMALLMRLQAERDALLVLGLGGPHREAILDRRERRRVVAKRKRKKRRKKKTPETSSSRGCARHRQRQWHTLYAGDRGVVLLHAVFPSIVDRPEMPCIMAGMVQKDRCSGLYMAGIAGYDAPRTVWLAGPECPAFWPVWTRRTVAVAWTMLVLLVILHLALCFLPCCHALDACRQARRQVCIMAGMDQMEGYVVPCRKLRKMRSCSSSTRSSTSLSFRRGRSPWSRLLRRPQRFPSCVLTGRSMPLLCRTCSSGLLLFAPCIWQSLYCVRCSPLEYRTVDFLGVLFRMFSVFDTPRFDSGYCLASVYEAVLKNFTRGPSYFSAMLGSFEDSCLCVRPRRLVLLVTLPLALCSLPRGQAHEAWHHGLYTQKDSYELGRACQGWLCWWPCISRCAR